MARYALIDGYLEAMRDGLRWRQDLDDLVSEMEDHLYSTVEHMCSRGQEPTAAERSALDRFGDPKTLASVYASTNNGGLAVPTKFTRTAGLMAIVAAVLLIPVAVASTSDLWTDSWEIPYAVGTTALVAASLLMLIFAIGLKQRTGARGVLPIVAIVFGVIGTVLSLVFWFIPGWGAAIGVSTLAMAWIVLRVGAGPVIPTVLYGIGFPAGAVAFVLAHSLKVGTAGEYNEYPAAFAIGIGLACVLTAIGLLGMGLWLRGEEAVELEAPAISA
jgi:hypothetical protein